jgi:uncharacterized protein (TIGR02145 family)
MGYANLSSDGTVSNDIIYGSSNTVYLDENSSIEVTFSDIEGGWIGEGNIDADPLFVSPDNGDFHLQSDSPCIDAGDPGYTDPDGTIADMGAYPTYQGCTDPEAINYNSDANYDDGSCYHDTVMDIDGNEYHAVQIGDQLWMKENLKVTHYRNGDEIPTGYSNEEWINLSTGAYAVYLDDESNADTYGYLYNWYAVDDSRNIAPEGWHVPTDDELSILASIASGKALKEIGFEHWEDPGEEYHQYYEGLDIYGFTGLPGGSRSGSSGGYGSMGLYGNFWSATADSSYSAAAWWWTLRAYWSDFDRGLSGVSYNNGGSIRCVKD